MSLKTSRLIILTAITTSFSHCGKKDSDESSPKQSDADAAAGEFLSPDDLKMTANVSTLSTFDVKSKLETALNFYDHNPKPSAQDCYTNLLNSSTVSASASMIEFHAGLDATACFQQSMKSSTAILTVNSAKVYVAASLGFDGSDLSQYNGKTFSEILNKTSSAATCDHATTISKMMKLKLSVDVSGTVGTSTVTMKIMGYQSNSTADLKPCTAKLAGDVATFNDGCLEVSRTVTTEARVDGKPSSSEGKEDGMSLTYRGLQSAKGHNTWYKGGSMDVILNGWTGAVTYTSPTTAPTYKLAKAGQTVSGTITGPLTTSFTLDFQTLDHDIARSISDQLRVSSILPSL